LKITTEQISFEVIGESVLLLSEINRIVLFRFFSRAYNHSQHG